MISDTIPLQYKTNVERGFPDDSFYQVVFEDGSVRSEKDTNWSEMSTLKVVGYFGKKKQVRVSDYPVALIKVFHEGMETEIQVPEGCEVYQAIRSQISVVPDGTKRESISGRVVGFVKDDEVVEERFISGRTHEILGLRA